MAIALVGLYWLLTFAPHPDNVAVVVITSCKEFYAFNRVEVAPEDDQARVRAAEFIPEGCPTKGYLVRRPGDDPTQEYDVEVK